MRDRGDRTRRNTIIRAAVVMILGVFGPLSCRARTVSGAQCVSSLDCTDPLVCAAGVCREQCRVPRDCLGGAQCVMRGALGVCVPPGASRPCAVNSDCDDRQRCVEGVCRATCTQSSDCMTGTCNDGVCTGEVLVPPSDAGVDGGCATMCGARCVDTRSDPNHCGACGNACALDQVCTDARCSTCTADAGCPVAFDECESAREITLRNGAADFFFPTRGLTHSPQSCSVHADGFIALQLAQRSVGFLSFRSQRVEFGYLGDGCGRPAVNCSASLGGEFPQGRTVLAVEAADPGVTEGDIYVRVVSVGNAAPVSVISGRSASFRAEILPGSHRDPCGGTGGFGAFWTTESTATTATVRCSGAPSARVAIGHPELVDCPTTARCDGSPVPFENGAGDVRVLFVLSGSTTAPITVDIETRL